MDLVLTHHTFEADGVFGTLRNNSCSFFCSTLEHAYLQSDGTYKPKLPNGTYTCARGQHILEGMTQYFETFEIQNVPGHSGILFHVGNFNRDSDGCVLLGEDILPQPAMLTKSADTFDKFMEAQRGCDTFSLVVKDSD